jgi:hypothetical protein
VDRADDESHSVDAAGYTLRLTGGTLHEGGVTAQAIFPTEFVGFQGHFPSGALLPGFMHVQVAIDTLRASGTPGELREISTGKFTAPILPNVPVTISIQRDGDHYTATLHTNSIPCSTFTFSLA